MKEYKVIIKIEMEEDVKTIEYYGQAESIEEAAENIKRDLDIV